MTFNNRDLTEFFYLKLSVEPFSKGSRSAEAEPLLARRNARNSLYSQAPERVNFSRSEKERKPQAGFSLKTLD